MISRMTFYLINLTGLFLILNRDHDDESPTRLIVGGALMAVGTLGLVAVNVMRRRKAKTNDSAATPQ